MNPDVLNIEHLRGWIGRTQTQVDLAGEAPLRALSATLDRDDPPPKPGDVIPSCWHWLYFLPTHRQSALGPDGHPLRGGFLPPVPLPRRMWAASRLSFLAPLRVGQAIVRTSMVKDVTTKAGRSGPLVFVTVAHEISADGAVAIREEHDIVYREAVRPGPVDAPPRVVGHSVDASRRVVPDDVLLFRYSALTFNGHRIHYDRRYVTQVEGYPGLVVHGPLIATLLLDLLRRTWPHVVVRAFSFRALLPLFDTAPFDLCARRVSDTDIELWASNPQGHRALQALAHVGVGEMDGPIGVTF